MGSDRLRAIVATTVVSAATVTMLASACADSASPPTRQPTSLATTTPAGSPVTTTPAPDESGPIAAEFEDGRHAVYLHGIDVDHHRMTVDVIQFLSGSDAIEAYRADNPGETEGPPNDYYIVNHDPRLHTLPVAETVTVELVRLHEDGDADLDPGTWGELRDYLAEYQTDDGRLSHNPFWITVHSHVVVSIKEQYVP